MNISVQNISSSIEKKPLLKNVHVDIASGEFVGLIGPNGSGKSTLLKNIYRVLKPDAGMITLDDENIFKLSSRNVAQKLAVVSQETPSLFDFTVAEIVSMGRSPHKKFLEADSKKDHQVIDHCLQKVGMTNFIHTPFTSLSGGEKQRVMIARALAQEAQVLVLDEPTNHLDIHHQLQILDLVRKLNMTVFAALHDLNLAAAYCDCIYVIENGEIITSGAPSEVLTTDMLKEVFRVEADIIVHPLTNKIHITYLSEEMIKQSEREVI
ncbi:ABC transporter ATP-binding protein [Bacillus sp. FJAT-42315]|uniref:ABC transporter ATP-binding protein n=1 Tax=Bacillus sp. FJAT-42315 TaxID=2014077 RepID=UPI000C251145|nr:ABC transporter ATP-binding protein [Bacillus sp. FJAT-42315]